MHLLAAGLLAQATTTTTTASSQQAPNPILPSGTEILWGTLAFVVLVVLMWKYAFPSVQKAMQARTEKIRTNLEDAEHIRTEAQQILEDYQRQLADARNESNRIIEEARQAAEQVRQEMIRRADEEVGELRRRNTEDLRAAQERVLGQLQVQVRGLAIDLAEKVVAANLDRDRNLQLVDQFIAELNARPAASTGDHKRAGS
jgi:F-type H+-transporting ATPase subunit b